MKTLKRGSVGGEVRELQQLLGIKVDSVFGPATELAVKNYQKAHDILADGIVGQKTWALLQDGKSTSKAVADWVIYDPLKVHLYDRPKHEIKYIVIHYTESGSSEPGRARRTKHTFETREASADFCVDDRDVVQFNPDIANFATWQCGGIKYSNTKGAAFYGKCTNTNSIGIEMCSYNHGGTFSASNHEKWGVTLAVIENTVRLVKLLMKKYNITADRVIRHWDVTGKLCPGIIGWNDDKVRDAKTGARLSTDNNSQAWLAFKKRLK